MRVGFQTFNFRSQLFKQCQNFNFEIGKQIDGRNKQGQLQYLEYFRQKKIPCLEKNVCRKKNLFPVSM